MKIVYLAKGKVHLLEDGKAPKVIESKFGQTVRDRAVRIIQRDAWKNEGSGARFMSGRLLWGDAGRDPAEMRIAVKSLSRSPESDRLLYALETDDMGGIFSISTCDLEEQRLFHHAKYFVEHLCAAPGHGLIACAVRNRGGTANIAIMKADGSDLKEVTEGDSVDLAPSWMPGRPMELLFQSAGVGRDSAGIYRDLGPFSICSLDLTRGEIVSLAENPRCDFLGPRMSEDGALFYISRPYKPAAPAASPLQAFKDFLLFPFRLLFAVFQWLNFFTARYTGRPLTTAGGPRKEGADIRQMMIWGNLINANEAIRAKYRDTGEVPGLVPATWQLVREKAGHREVLAKGVLSYDLCVDGSIVYTNGNAIYRREPEGNCRKLHVDDGIEQVIDMVDLNS
ncbi:MAG TPA: hypothetical protein VFG19_09885 [Geobacteraceae bacterium]|nr:hypothetical protein [Geobacteraceae bacterium]